MLLNLQAPLSPSSVIPNLYPGQIADTEAAKRAATATAERKVLVNMIMFKS